MAKLYFYYAAMNAGKTTMLLQSAHNYEERGMETIIFTPLIDNRYAEGTVHSRIGLSRPATCFDETFDFVKHVAKMRTEKSKLCCVLVDEAQFLTKNQVSQLTNIVDDLNLPVLTYGLRTDFQGNPFEASTYLLALADHLVEIKTICSCGRKATMNLRLDEQGNVVREGSQVQIGGNERYISVCRYHFKVMINEKVCA